MKCATAHGRRRCVKCEMYLRFTDQFLSSSLELTNKKKNMRESNITSLALRNGILHDNASSSYYEFLRHAIHVGPLPDTLKRAHLQCEFIFKLLQHSPDTQMIGVDRCRTWPLFQNFQIILRDKCACKLILSLSKKTIRIFLACGSPQFPFIKKKTQKKYEGIIFIVLLHVSAQIFNSNENETNKS